MSKHIKKPLKSRFQRWTCNKLLVFYGGARLSVVLLSSTIVILLYLNSSAIYYAFVSDMFSKQQLIVQSFFVFLVPFLGAMLVLVFSITQIDRASFKPSIDKPKTKLLNYLFLAFLVSNNTSDGLGNDSNPNDFGGQDGSGD